MLQNIYYYIMYLTLIKSLNVNIYIGASEWVGGGIGPSLFKNMRGAKYVLPKKLKIYY